MTIKMSSQMVSKGKCHSLTWHRFLHSFLSSFISCTLTPFRDIFYFIINSYISVFSWNSLSLGQNKVIWDRCLEMNNILLHPFMSALLLSKEKKDIHGWLMRSNSNVSYSWKLHNNFRSVIRNLLDGSHQCVTWSS